MKITPLGDGALTIELGNVISDDLNLKAVSLAEHITAHPFPGLIETLPAYSSVAVFYDLAGVRIAFPEFPTAFEAVREIVSSGLQDESAANNIESRLIEIPVDFSDAMALDLDSIAEYSGLGGEEI